MRKLAKFDLYMLLYALLIVGLLLTAPPLHAANNPVPRNALKHRAELTRIAHAQWGLAAPVPAIAAQIHQESGWNSAAVSTVGAKGMAQFMPATAKWWCGLNRISPSQCVPTNPTWAMRAMVGYDYWLYQRVQGATTYDRYYAALRSYNGGLGHWQAEAKRAGSFNRQAVDAACGKAKRSKVHCAENLGYPRRILTDLQPRYASWGVLMTKGAS